MSWLYAPLLPATDLQSGGAVATSPAIFYYNLSNDSGEIMYLRQSTASQEILLGKFVDSTDGNTAETGLTIANTDIKIFKNGATTLADKNSGGATHISGGLYYAVLDATDTDTIGILEVHCHPAGALPVKRSYVVLDEAVYDALFGTVALATATNITAASGVTVSTNNDKSGYSLSSAGVQALLDAAVSALTSVGSIGKRLVDNIDAAISSRLPSASYTAPLDAAGTRAAVGLSAANLDSQLATIDSSADDIKGVTDKLVDTLELDGVVYRFTSNSLEQAPSGGSAPTAVEIRQEMDSNSTQLAAIVADTNELQTDLTNGGRLDTILDDIKTDTVAIRTKFKKGSAKSNFKFTMADSTTGAPLSGLTVTGLISKDGAAFASVANAITEISSGWYNINLTASEMNADSIALRFSATGAITKDFTLFTQA